MVKYMPVNVLTFCSNVWRTEAVLLLEKWQVRSEMNKQDILQVF